MKLHKAIQTAEGYTKTSHNKTAQGHWKRMKGNIKNVQETEVVKDIYANEGQHEQQYVERVD